MLEVLDDIICSSIMALTGIYVVSKILNIKDKHIFPILIALIIFVAISIILHPIQYTPLYTITILLLNIIIFKKLFKLTFEQSTIVSGIFLFTLFLSDIIVATIFKVFYTTTQLRTDFLISIMANLSTSILE